MASTTFESDDSIENENELTTIHPIEDGKHHEIDGSEGNKCSRIISLICPICMGVWAENGEHTTCCLPCGHIYGKSCIERWLRHNDGSGKCPQCNKICSLEDVRRLYAPIIVAVDEESEKRMMSLEARTVSLDKLKSIEARQDTLEEKLKEQGIELRTLKASLKSCVDMVSFLKKDLRVTSIFVFIALISNCLIYLTLFLMMK